MPTIGLTFEDQTDSVPMKRAWITVDTVAINSKGETVLTSECVSLREIESEVERIRQELDGVLEAAKRCFAAETAA